MEASAQNGMPALLNWHANQNYCHKKLEYTAVGLQDYTGTMQAVIQTEQRSSGSRELGISKSANGYLESCTCHLGFKNPT